MIKDSLVRLGNSPIMEGAQLENFDPSECHDRQKSPTVMTSTRDGGFKPSSPAINIECIYVDEDQFHVDIDKIPRSGSDRKGRYKLIKSTIQRAKSYLSQLCDTSTF